MLCKVSSHFSATLSIGDWRRALSRTLSFAPCPMSRSMRAKDEVIRGKFDPPTARQC